MKQVLIGMLNQLNSGEEIKTISFLFSTKKDVRITYDSSFNSVKDLLCEKLQDIIDSMPDEEITEE